MLAECASNDAKLGRRPKSLHDSGLHGAELARHVRLERATSLVSKSMRKSAISVSECLSRKADHGMTDPMPYHDAYLAVVNLVPTSKDLWLGERPVRSEPLASGALVFHDLRQSPSANFKTPFHTLNFCLPRAVLHEVADHAHAARIDELNFVPGRGYDDEPARGLSLALLPAFAMPEQVNQLFVDSVTLAFATHIAQKFGGMRHASRPPIGGLAPWQERRAKEIMSADLQGETPIAFLAAECRLSVAHFSRCFRQSTGLAPHQWLLKQRVAMAKDMLSPEGCRENLSLADISLACGFADRSHFTRVFSAATGVSPGVWRRGFSKRIDALT